MLTALLVRSRSGPIYFVSVVCERYDDSCFLHAHIYARDAVLKLKPNNKIILKPRSETIVQASTNRNEIGVIQTQETAPGVYIGRCIVEPKNFLCPISVANTIDDPVEIQIPYVMIEDIENVQTHGIYTVATDKDKSLPRRERI